MGQPALHCAVVLHGPKINLVAIPEDDWPHGAAVKLLRLRRMLYRVPRLGKTDWPGCVLVLFITTQRATAYRCRMPGAQTSDNHVVDLMPAAVVAESHLAPIDSCAIMVIRPSSPCTSV